MCSVNILILSISTGTDIVSGKSFLSLPATGILLCGISFSQSFTSEAKKVKSFLTVIRFFPVITPKSLKSGKFPTKCSDE